MNMNNYLAIKKMVLGDFFAEEEFTLAMLHKHCELKGLTVCRNTVRRVVLALVSEGVLRFRLVGRFIILWRV